MWFDCLHQDILSILPLIPSLSHLHRVRAVTTTALFGKKTAPPPPSPPSKKGATKGKTAPTTTASGPKKQPSQFSKFLNAVDFNEVAGKSDADLIYQAKYGKLKDGKMTPDQYAALRRKVETRSG